MSCTHGTCLSSYTSSGTLLAQGMVCLVGINDWRLLAKSVFGSTRLTEQDFHRSKRMSELSRELPRVRRRRRHVLGVSVH